MLLLSNLDEKPTWLLSETGNSSLEADPMVPPNQNIYIYIYPEIGEFYVCPKERQAS